MMKMNKTMADAILETTDVMARISIPKELSGIAQKGFAEEDGAYVLRHFLNRKAQCIEKLDTTGVEAFINSVHIDDYVSHNHLLTAIEFVCLVRDEWHLLTSDQRMMGLISLSETGANVKFYCNRVGVPPYLSDDIESFDQPVLEADLLDPMWAAIAPR